MADSVPVLCAFVSPRVYTGGQFLLLFGVAGTLVILYFPFPERLQLHLGVGKQLLAQHSADSNVSSFLQWLACCVRSGFRLLQGWGRREQQRGESSCSSSCCCQPKERDAWGQQQQQPSFGSENS